MRMEGFEIQEESWREAKRSGKEPDCFRDEAVEEVSPVGTSGY